MRTFRTAVVPTRHKRMLQFLLASLCLHAGFVLPWTPIFEFAGNRETVLTVTFDAPRRAIVVTSKRAARSVPAKETESAAAPAPTSDTPAAVRHTETSTQTSQTSDDAVPDAGPESARAQIQAKLLTDLRHHFEYPLLARRQGWQGTVWLAFTLETDGALEHIHVARSSGYDVLDNSAIAAMKRVGRLAGAGRWLNGHAFDMRVPVVYRLKDN